MLTVMFISLRPSKDSSTKLMCLYLLTYTD
uniref:Uncharacterized protein n=1 Tax=Arundo donax TaxID=35708 RepID=A0A0A9GN31_ARUDO